MNEFFETIKNSQNITLTGQKEINNDSFCASLALFYTLNKLGKNVNLSLPKILEKLNFLTTNEVFESLNQSNVVVSIDTVGEKIEKVLYEKNTNELNFNLDLKGGKIQIEDLSFKIREKSDLTINMENESFVARNNDGYMTPLQTDLCSKNYTSVSEKIIDFLKSADEKLIDKNIATCLLAGIISSTQNFQNKKTSCEILNKASYLVEKGADYQKIIQYLYKTKSLSEIKILGKILEKISFNNEKTIAWAIITKGDFTTTQSSSKDLSFVMEAIKSHFSAPETIFFLWETEQNCLTKGIIYSSEMDKIQKINNAFPCVSKENCAIFVIKNANLKEAENKILETINI